MQFLDEQVDEIWISAFETWGEMNGDTLAFTVFNLLFACLYLFRKTLGSEFYRWIVHDS